MIYSVRYSPNGKLIVSSSEDASIKIWNSYTGDIIKTLTGHSTGIYSSCFTSDSSKIISGSQDQTIKIW
jgi:WD40 repeat protein